MNYLKKTLICLLCFSYCNIILSQKNNINLKDSLVIPADNFYSKFIGKLDEILYKSLIQKDAPSKFSITIDQDVFAPFNLNRDQNYTMGGMLNLEKNNINLNKMMLFLLDMPTKLLYNQIGLEKNGNFEYKRSRLQLGISGFTPFELEKEEPILDDRPYSLLTYLQFSNTFVRTPEAPDNRINLAFKNSLFLGQLGGSEFAKDVQTFIHSGQRGIADSSKLSEVRPDPLGWHNQLSNEGKFAFQITHEITYNACDKILWNLKSRKLRERKVRLMLNGNLSFNAGIYNFFSSGGQMIIGMTSSNFYDLNSFDRGISKFRDCEEANPDLDWFEIFILAQGNVNVWVKNSLLEGWSSKSNDPVKLSPIATETFTFDGAIGVGGILFHRIYWNYLVMSRSKEFNTSKGRSHTWGRVEIGMRGFF